MIAPDVSEALWKRHVARTSAGARDPAMIMRDRKELAFIKKKLPPPERA
jgi:hypothetical protein